MSDGHHHRSSLKQQNKSFKGLSKGSHKRENHGRVESVKVSVKRAVKAGQKERRLAHNRDVSKQKHNEAALRKRLGSRFGPPKIVGVISLSPTLEVGKLAQLIRDECEACPEVPSSFPFIQTLRTTVEKRESRFTFVLTPRDPVAVADVAKVADVVLLVMNPTDADGEDLGVDNLGNHFLQLLKAQGVPQILGVTTGASAIATPKRRQNVARLAQRFFHTVFNTDCKVVNVDTPAETQSMIRLVHNATDAQISWRTDRARMLGEHVDYVPNDGSELAAAAAAAFAAGEADDQSDLFTPGMGQLRVTGFLRGNRTLSANQLVHITGFGDFPIVRIEGADGDLPAWGKGQTPAAAAAAAAAAARNVLSVPTAEREGFQDLLPESTVALGAEGGDDITADELAAAVAQNPDLAATSSMFSVGADGSVSVAQQAHGPQKPVFSDWRSQDTPIIESFSTLAAELETARAQAPQTAAESIAVVRKQEVGGVGALKSVWDDIEVSDSDDDNAAGAKKGGVAMGDNPSGSGFGELDADLARGLGRGSSTFRGLNGTCDDDEEEMMDGVDISGGEEDDEGEWDAGRAAEDRRAARTAARREDKALDGLYYDDTASNITGFSQFSMGSLRSAGASAADVATKFKQLPWAEKIRRLCKYGLKGEEKLLRLKKRLEREEFDFPDEVEWDRRITARARFALYRPLKSFRQSAWDHNESLPREYGRILQFANFTIAERNAKDACSVENLYGYEDEEDDEMADDDEPVFAPEGRPIAPERATPITIVVANVPPEAAAMIAAGQALALVWGLMRHEHKVSVLHFHLRRHPEYDLPVKNSDAMHFQVGFRRFTTSPTFSVQTRGTQKLLMQRFVRPGENFVASVYGRVTFPSATVLMFPAHVLGSYREEFPFNPLVASGTLLTCDPNRVILKRAILSGYPIKVSYNSCVIKHMFSTPADVQWFRTVEIWTKQGLFGRIKESRGLHGVFKAHFNNVIKHKKPVYMTLYKRQFPPWNPNYLG